MTTLQLRCLTITLVTPLTVTTSQDSYLVYPTKYPELLRFDLLTLNWRVSNAGRRCVPSCSTTDHTPSTEQRCMTPAHRVRPGRRAAHLVSLSQPYRTRMRDTSLFPARNPAAPTHMAPRALCLKRVVMNTHSGDVAMRMRSRRLRDHVTRYSRYRAFIDLSYKTPLEPQTAAAADTADESLISPSSSRF